MTITEPTPTLAPPTDERAGDPSPVALTTVSAVDLHGALVDLAAALGRPTDQLSAAVRIVTDGLTDTIRLERTDGWRHATATIPATPGEVREKAPLLVSAWALAGIAKSLGTHAVHLGFAGGYTGDVADGAHPRGGSPRMLTVAGDGALWRLRPDMRTGWIEVPGGEHGIDVHRAELDADAVAILRRATSGASQDATLPILTGVRLSTVDGTHLRAEATDRYRLAEATAPTVYPMPGAWSSLIPADVLTLAHRWVRPGQHVTLDEFVPAKNAHTVFAGTPAITLRTPTRSLRVPLIDGEYPKVGALWSTEPHETVTLDATALAVAVRRAGLMAERNTPVRLTTTDRGTLQVAGGGQDPGEGSALANVALNLEDAGIPGGRHDTPTVAVALNPQYLLDALNAVTTPGKGDHPITLHALMAHTSPAGATTRPVVLTSPALAVRVLLMPVRLAG